MNCNNRRIFGLNYRKKRQKLVIRSTSMWIVKFRTMIWYKLGNSTEFKPSFASWWAMFTPALRLDFFRGIYTRETLAIKFPLRPVCDFTEFPSRCRLFFSFSSRSPRRRHVRHCVSGQPLLIVLPNFTGSTLWGFVLVDCHRWFFSRIWSIWSCFCGKFCLIFCFQGHCVRLDTTWFYRFSLAPNVNHKIAITTVCDFTEVLTHFRLFLSLARLAFRPCKPAA